MLNAVCSMDWHGSLLAAAGKEGRCSIFVLPPNSAASDADSDNNPTHPLLSCRLHQSWVAEVQFVGRGASSGDTQGQ